MIQAAEIEQMTFAAGGHAGNCGPTSDHLHHPHAKTWFEVQGDLSMARRDPATVNDGQTLFQELLTFRLRELVHLRTILLNNPSPNRLLG